MGDENITVFFGAGESARPEAPERAAAAETLKSLMPVEAGIYADSVCKVPDGLLAMVRSGGEDLLAVLCPRDNEPMWSGGFEGQTWGVGRALRLNLVPNTAANLWTLRDLVSYVTPRALGAAPSFGFGDRTGLATPGHILAAMDAGDAVAPIFAQQSIREMTRTGRTARRVMDDAAWGVFRMGWDKPFGADADHLKTFEDAAVTVDAGFVFFTIDPSDHVDQGADDYTESRAREAFEKLAAEKEYGLADLPKLYAGKTFDIDGDGEKHSIKIDEVPLLRCAVKYGRALAHTARMAGFIGARMGGRAFEIEMSVDETAQPTSPLEHLVIGLELRRRGVKIISLAPRFVGDFEKGVDYKGDLAVFEKELRVHAAVARLCGPYKISVHSGSDKFAVYPALGRVCDTWHVKTAGTSYLEALRAAVRADAALFREIVEFSRERFETDRATYHISARLDHAPPPAEIPAAELERNYLVDDSGRQIMHVTFGSVLTAVNQTGRPLFYGRIMKLLRENDALHGECLRTHFGKHLRALLSGVEKRPGGNA